MNIKLEDLIETSREDMLAKILAEINEVFQVRDEVEDPVIAKNIEKYVLLQAVDKNWQNHLSEMDDLRKSVGLRSYGQKDPLNEYKSEAFKFFGTLVSKIRDDILLKTFGSASKIEVIQAMINRLENVSSNKTEEDKETLIEDKKEEQVEENTPIERELPKLKTPDLSEYGRNDLVKIVRGNQIQELKFKKAKELIENEGWRILK